MKKTILNIHQNQTICLAKYLTKTNLVTIRKRKLPLKLNKPAYTAMCILELSKVLMYEFYYGYMGNKYNNKSKLLFTDTDSLMY